LKKHVFFPRGKRLKGVFGHSKSGLETKNLSVRETELLIAVEGGASDSLGIHKSR